ncbi:Glyoxalase-like domain-containing protein [Micromonospora coriariae]|uniref:Glyoxalase-like domain-containing protein n=1 Tax=Micromonospora coriariae TaxID=285665 RepID=A0A1C4VAG0_9ACTN|nr:VOC family protein [Micromonospora coriariae]SCE80886.1 Glyoxalase-like domain-containing protein [Micromonospora coriariae]
MVVRMAQCTIDVEDVDLMVAFWSAALGYEIEQDGDGSAKLWPPGQPSAAVPSVWLQGSGTPKRGKNRLHLDLVSDGDPQVEVRRLIELGARQIDVGQTGTEQFTVLADPEGNEFCVLDSPPTR